MTKLQKTLDTTLSAWLMHLSTALIWSQPVSVGSGRHRPDGRTRCLPIFRSSKSKDN